MAKSQMKGKLKTAMRALAAKRKAGGKLSFAQFLEDEYGYSINRLHQELGIDLNRTTVKQFMDFDEDIKSIFPEYIRDALQVGSPNQPNYDGIVANTIYPDSQSVNYQYIDYAPIEKMKNRITRSKGATPREIEIDNRQKTVMAKDIAVKVRVHNDAIKYSTLGSLPNKLAPARKRYDDDVAAILFDVLINGDQGRDTKTGLLVECSPPIVGVLSTTNGITEDDYRDLAIDMGAYGRQVSSIAGHPTLQKKITRWEDFEKRLIGAANVDIEHEFPLPTKLKNYQTFLLASDKMLLVSQMYALEKFVPEDLYIESEKDIFTDLHLAVIKAKIGYANIHRDGRVIIDGSKEIGSNGLPTWFGYE